MIESLSLSFLDVGDVLKTFVDKSTEFGSGEVFDLVAGLDMGSRPLQISTEYGRNRIKDLQAVFAKSDSAIVHRVLDEDPDRLVQMVKIARAIYRASIPLDQPNDGGMSDEFRNKRDELSDRIVTALSKLTNRTMNMKDENKDDWAINQAQRLVPFFVDEG